MTDEYRRGYLDALHYSAGVALAFERMAESEFERQTYGELRREIEAYAGEIKGAAGETEDRRRMQLLSSAPELLTTLKHLLASIERGIDINPGSLGEYRYVVRRAEGLEV